MMTYVLLYEDLFTNSKADSAIKSLSIDLICDLPESLKSIQVDQNQPDWYKSINDNLICIGSWLRSAILSRMKASPQYWMIIMNYFINRSKSNIFFDMETLAFKLKDYLLDRMYFEALEA